MSMFKFSMLICVPIDGTSVFPTPKNKSIVGLVLIRVSSRTVPSREVPGRSRDGTGPGDPEGPGTKEVKKSRDFF